MDMNIKGVDKALVQSAKLAAIGRGMTLREFVISVLESTVQGGETGRRGTTKESGNSGSKHVRTSPRDAEAPHSTVSSSLTPETKVCKRCDGVVERDPKNPKYWLCPKGRCGRQLSDAEVKNA